MGLALFLCGLLGQRPARLAPVDLDASQLSALVLPPFIAPLAPDAIRHRVVLVNGAYAKVGLAGRAVPFGLPKPSVLVTLRPPLVGLTGRACESTVATVGRAITTLAGRVVSLAIRGILVRKPQLVHHKVVVLRLRLVILPALLALASVVGSGLVQRGAVGSRASRKAQPADSAASG